MSLEVHHDPSEEALGDLRLVLLWQYWLGLCDGGSVPSRGYVSPTEIGPVLSWTFLIDVTPQEGYRYRLVGTGIVREMGYDMTGQLVSRAYAGPDWDQVQQDYQWVIENRKPCLTHNSVVIPVSRQNYSYRRLLLPLANDGQHVDMLIGAAIGPGSTVSD